MIILRKLPAWVACGLLSWVGAASANVVVDWNDIAVQAVGVGRPGPVGALDLALVQAAVHDAVQAIEGRFEPYHAEIPRATGSRAAAAAAAAHDVLVGCYPEQSAALDAAYQDYLATKGLNGNPGLAVGHKIALEILPLRRLDPDPLPPDFVGGTNPGEWRPTDSFIGDPPGPPPPFSPMAAPWVADIDPFTLTSPARFRADPPPALSSAKYTKNYNEVKALGEFDSSVRSPGQTDIAYFWNENSVVLWNRTLRDIATAQGVKVGDSARLFALANLAAADAVISAWESKKHYLFWRPLTAIRKGNDDGNPDTVGDPSWQPLVNTPNYPDYPANAPSVASAMTRTLALFFGTDQLTFSITSLNPLAIKKTRTFDRFSSALQQVVNARVYEGIHFRFADAAARTQGRRVADWVSGHFLLPLPSEDSGTE